MKKTKPKLRRGERRVKVWWQGKTLIGEFVVSPGSDNIHVDVYANDWSPPEPWVNVGHSAKRTDERP